jgi:uncharacterized protein (TIGR03435 family)
MAYVRFASVDAYGMSVASIRVANQPIAGEPEWANTERYTIDAKPESPQTAAMMRGPMLQTLVEDRFQLKMHHEAKDVQVYALVVGKGGSKLVPTAKGSCTALDFNQDAPPQPPQPGQTPPCGPFRSDKSGRVETLAQTVAGLCRQFSVALDRDVIDRTELAGAFDIHLDMSLDELFPFARPLPPRLPTRLRRSPIR